MSNTDASPSDYIHYLTRNGYTEDALRWFEAKFTEGVAARRAGESFAPYQTQAWRLGWLDAESPVEDYFYVVHNAMNNA